MHPQLLWAAIRVSDEWVSWRFAPPFVLPSSDRQLSLAIGHEHTMPNPPQTHPRSLNLFKRFSSSYFEGKSVERGGQIELNDCVASRDTFLIFNYQLAGRHLATDWVPGKWSWVAPPLSLNQMCVMNLFTHFPWRNLMGACGWAELANEIWECHPQTTMPSIPTSEHPSIQPPPEICQTPTNTPPIIVGFCLLTRTPTLGIRN